MIQKNIFNNGEGDNWYLRNQSTFLNFNSDLDPIIQGVRKMHITPSKVLEIGCSNGFRLNSIAKLFGSQCFGIDPSIKAIEEGKNLFDNITLEVGSADSIPFSAHKFDLIIFGFCLYLCDRNDLFKIAYEADRYLLENGYVCVLDFFPPFPYKNKYIHTQNVNTYKMDYSRLFSWNPSYRVIYNCLFSHSGLTYPSSPDDETSVCVLKKSDFFAYPEKPFYT